MNLEHITLFSGDTITARRLKNILEEHKINAIIKEDKIVGYEISNNSSELLVLNVDKEKAIKIIKEALP